MEQTGARPNTTPCVGAATLNNSSAGRLEPASQTGLNPIDNLATSLHKVDLMTLLSDNVLYALEKHFSRYDVSGLTLSQFVQVIVLVFGRNVIGKRIDFALQAISLFKQIDVDGSNTVSWAEFTSFIVDQVGNRTKKVTHQSGWDEYVLHDEIVSSNATRGKVHSISYSAEHSIFAVFDHNSDVGKLYQISPGEPLSMYQRQTLRHHTSFAPHTCLSVYFVPGTNTIVTSSKQLSRRKRAVYWMSFFQLGKALPYHRLQLANAVTVMFYSEKSKVLYTASSGPIVGRDLKSFAKVANLKWHTATVTCILQHQEKLISSSRDGTVCLWDMETGNKRVLVAHSAGVRSIAACESPSSFVSIGFEKGARSDAVNIAVWNLKRGRISRHLQGHNAPIVAIQFRSSKGDTGLDYRPLLSADMSGEFRVWNIFGTNSGTCLQVIDLHTPLSRRGMHFWGFVEIERRVSYSSTTLALDKEDQNAAKLEDQHGEPAHAGTDDDQASTMGRESVGGSSVKDVRTSVSCAEKERTSVGNKKGESGSETSLKEESETSTKEENDSDSSTKDEQKVITDVTTSSVSWKTKSMVVAFRDDLSFLQLSLEHVYPSPRRVVCILFNAQLACFVVVTQDAIHKYDSMTGKWLQTFSCGAKCLAACRVVAPSSDQSDQGRTQEGSGGEKLEVTSACLGKNMRSLIVGDDHGHIHMHNLSNGSVSKYIAKHELLQPSAPCRPRELAPVLHKRVPKVDRSCAETGTGPGPSPHVPISSLAYSPSDDCILSASWGGLFRVMDNRFGSVGVQGPPRTAPSAVSAPSGGFVPWRLTPNRLDGGSDTLRQVQLVPDVFDRQDSACTAPDIQSMVFNANLNIVVTLCRGGFLGREQGLFVWDFEFARLLGQCAVTEAVVYGERTESEPGHISHSIPLLNQSTSGEITCMCTCKHLPVLITASNMDVITLWAMPPMKSRVYEPVAVFHVDLKTPAKECDEEEQEEEEEEEESITQISARAVMHGTAVMGRKPEDQPRRSRFSVQSSQETDESAVEIELVLGTDGGKVVVCTISSKALSNAGVQPVPNQRKPSYRAHRLVHRVVSQTDLYVESQQAKTRKQHAPELQDLVDLGVKELAPDTSWVVEDLNTGSSADEDGGAHAAVTFLDHLGDVEEDSKSGLVTTGPGVILVGLASGIAGLFDAQGGTLGLMNSARINETVARVPWEFSSVLTKYSGADLQGEARDVLGQLMMNPDEVVTLQDAELHAADMVQHRRPRGRQEAVVAVVEHAEVQESHLGKAFERVHRALDNLNCAGSPRHLASQVRPATVHGGRSTGGRAFLTGLRVHEAAGGTRPSTSAAMGAGGGRTTEKAPDHGAGDESDALLGPTQSTSQDLSSSENQERSRLTRRSQQMKRLRQRVERKRSSRLRASAARVFAKNNPNVLRKSSVSSASEVVVPGRISQRFLTPEETKTSASEEGDGGQGTDRRNESSSGKKSSKQLEPLRRQSMVTGKKRWQDIVIPKRQYQTYSTMAKYLEDSLPG